MSQTQVHRQKLDRCPLCKSEDIQPWLTGRDILLGRSEDTFPYMRCETCNLYFQSDRPIESEIGYWYQGDYGPYGRSSKEKPGLAGKAVAFLHRKAAKFARKSYGHNDADKVIKRLYARHLGRGATLLDFGCGSGAFLDRAREKYGCVTIGTDFAEDVLAEVRSRGHRVVTQAEGGLDAIAGASVDVVRLSHVIEHLYDPGDMLVKLQAKLKPGGMIHLATPDPEGPSIRQFKENGLGLDAPRHIMLFTPRRLQALAEKSGFTSFQVILEPTVWDWMRSLQRSRGKGDRWEGQVSVGDILSSIEPTRQSLQEGHADRYSLFAWK